MRRTVRGVETSPSRAPGPPALRSMAAVGAVATMVGAVLGVAVGSLLSLGLDVVALVVAAVLAGIVGVLAVIRFDLFVLFLLFTRASLDVLGRGGIKGGAIDPAAAVGAMFIGASAFWLLAQHASGRWVRPSTATKGLYLLGGAAVASAITSPFPTASLEGASRLIAGILMFAVLEQLLARERSANRYIYALFGSTVVPVIVGWFQLLTGGGSTEAMDTPRLYATFAHPNVFASYLVSVILLALVVALRWPPSSILRRLSFVVLIATGPLLIGTYTRAAWGALAIGLVYLAVRLDRRILIGLGLALVLVVVLFPSTIERLTDVTRPEEVRHDGPTNSLQWRFEYWGQVLPLAEETPLTGIGLESTHRMGELDLPPHNTFVQVYVETGLLGAFALAVALLALAAQLRRQVKSAVVGSQQYYAAVAGIAIGMATLAEAVTENQLTRTVGYWYTALALLYGFGTTTDRSVNDPVEVDRPLPAPAPPTAGR